MRLRWFELRTCIVVGNIDTAIMPPFTDKGPSVVFALLNEIEFVAVAWPHFIGPEASLRIKGDAKWIAVAGRPE